MEHTFVLEQMLEDTAPPLRSVQILMEKLESIKWCDLTARNCGDCKLEKGVSVKYGIFFPSFVLLDIKSCSCILVRCRSEDDW